MSRVADAPIALPVGVEVNIQSGLVSVKGSRGGLDLKIPDLVKVVQEEGQLKVSPATGSKRAMIQAGTIRSLTANMVQGVTAGFEKKLLLSGVGYRVQKAGSTLNIALGFSHPVVYQLAAGVEAEVPSQTEIILRGVDKQKVGQAAAEIRSRRPFEPYKGKGIRYEGERIKLKEAKKK